MFGGFLVRGVLWKMAVIIILMQLPVWMIHFPVDSTYSHFWMPIFITCALALRALAPLWRALQEDLRKSSEWITKIIHLSGSIFFTSINGHCSLVYLPIDVNIVAKILFTFMHCLLNKARLRCLLVFITYRTATSPVTSASLCVFAKTTSHLLTTTSPLL